MKTGQFGSNMQVSLCNDGPVTIIIDTKKQGIMLLNKLQQQVDDWINQYGVRYFDELTNMAILTEEVGEVARIISRQYGEQSFKDSDHRDLGEELADVLFVVFCLANQTNTDLQASFDKKMEIITNRDAKRHHDNEKLNS